MVPGYGPYMPLPYVDPNKKRGRWYEATTRFASSRPGQFLARHVNPRIDPWLYRATGGRYPSCLGTIATAPLTATGAKSGQPREVELTYFHDGSDPILIASNYGGPKHPQWYYNLKAHPECEFGGERFMATQVTDPTSTHACTRSPSRSTPGTATIGPRRRLWGGRSLSSGSSRGSGILQQTAVSTGLQHCVLLFAWALAITLAPGE